MSDESNRRALDKHYRDVVSKMMYYNGDLEDPIPCCVDMVLDLVKFQMIKKMSSFSSEGHKFILKRLLNFSETVECINELKRTAPRTQKLDDDQDEDSNDDEIKIKSPVDSHFARMKNFVSSMGVAGNVGHLLELTDPELNERQRRIANTVMHDLSVEEYTRFTAARAASFLDDMKGKSKKKYEKGDLLFWLDAPPCEPSVSFVLAFIGREVVAYYVDAAIMVMKTEEPNLFLNDTKDGHVAAPYEDCPLQIRHYKEALRRCEGWRRRRDFLFGYYEEPEGDGLQENKDKISL
ncbi:hypothetical protein DICVIV_03556 [Dictyocaulus viviparus]|uniref:Uncharacterized protein n=1 Tax=Dictyocaulus viviparus TaxID=29172 RepID=A0A0D8Y092_DICVI|nr:hypothetical protein DICVIV_03556 [Dictyocaulus viviparus]